MARRFEDKQLAGLEAANAVFVARAFEVLPQVEQDRLRSVRPTIDLGPTDVEGYGAKKRGVAFNYAGQRVGRSHPGVWAEAGWVLAGDLGSGIDDPRPQAPDLIARSIAALPVGLGRPIIRADSGFFDSGVAQAALAAGADFAIAAKRNPAVWRAVRAVPDDAWEPAENMAGAEVAVCDYHPGGWPEQTRAIVRRVRVEATEIRADGRSRRRRTIDPDELKAVKQGQADHAYAYVVILTSLDWGPVEVEAWFRLRAQVEERLKDSKLGMALRHLPSGYPAINAVWMWAAFLALNISATLSALAKPTEAETTEAETTEMSLWRPRGRPDRAHGKRLRREIITVPGRLAHHARRLVVHLHPCQEAGPMLQTYAALVCLPSFAPT